MIQPAPRFLGHPSEAPKPDRSTHRARTASERRRRRAKRRSMLVPLRVIAVVAAALVPVLAYVMLCANVTGLSYAVAHEHATRAALLEEDARLEDRIARLTSRERLAAVAAKLHLHEPGREGYALIRLPDVHAAPAPRGIALLDWLVPR